MLSGKAYTKNYFSSEKSHQFDGSDLQGHLTSNRSDWAIE